MGKKVRNYFYCHPVVTLIIFVILISAFIVLIIKLPRIIVQIIAALLVIIGVAIPVIWSYKDKKAKKKMQDMKKEDYEKVWKRCVDIVEKTCEEQNYDRSKLNCNWIETFNDLIYSIAVNSNVLIRKFNDFDIAACLIYSLTWEDEDNRNILFSLECAKHLLNSPNIYIRHIGFGDELKLEVESTLKRVDFNFYDENITQKALLSIVEAYLAQKTTYGVVALSQFLCILYTKCA